MKNQKFYKRLIFSIQGLKKAWATENSFKTQVCFAILAIALLIFTCPEPIWWALFCLAISSVLMAELVNTAIEYFLDAFHPQINPATKNIKDVAAAAVLITSLASMGVFISYLTHLLKKI